MQQIIGIVKSHVLFKIFKQYFVPLLILAYILGDMYCLVYKRFYFYPYNALPVILFIVYTAIFHLQNLVYFLAFCTPLAISLKEMGLTQGPDLSIPSEPVMAGIMLVYILNLFHKPVADKRILQHPATRLIFLQLSWMLITTVSSTDVVVSIKYLISRLWFIFSCYIIVPHLFQKRENIIRFVFTYSVALAIVVAYTTVVHARFNFDVKAADWVVSPFYNDHTAYGAALAMFIPILITMLFYSGMSKFAKFCALGFLLVFLLAIIISYARAGWMSLAVALAIYISIALKIKFRTLLLSLGTAAVLFFSFQTEIVMLLSKNDTDSEGDFQSNIESMSNITTDASNLERLNRWSCALRMWEDKPVLGWGPGTYMFKYAPYQLSHQLTIISTNFGTNGNAHSEYLGPLAEQGLPGMLIVLGLLFYTAHLGYKLAYSLAKREDRIIALGLFLGLMTYFVHGFLNNFLDTDKLSLPFWAFLAGLVCFDIFAEKKEVLANKLEV